LLNFSKEEVIKITFKIEYPFVTHNTIYFVVDWEKKMRVLPYFLVALMAAAQDTIAPTFAPSSLAPTVAPSSLAPTFAPSSEAPTFSPSQAPTQA
jgi:hypothetical protein